MHITSRCWFSVYRDREPKYSWDGSQWERTASPAASLSRASTIYSITRYYIQRVRLLKTLFPELLGLVTSSGELTGTTATYGLLQVYFSDDIFRPALQLAQVRFYRVNYSKTLVAPLCVKDCTGRPHLILSKKVDRKKTCHIFTLIFLSP